MCKISPVYDIKTKTKKIFSEKRNYKKFLKQSPHFPEFLLVMKNLMM